MLLSATPLLFALALPSTPLASLPPALISAPTTIAAQKSHIPTAKEGESGHRYPIAIDSTVKTADAGNEDVKPLKLDLLGLAIREKTIFNVNVYSYVIYMDQATVKADLGKWKGTSAKKAGKDKALFAKLLTQSGTKELRLRFCRKVDAEDIVDAFEDSLRPRILKLKKGQKGTDAEKLKNLTSFRKFFTLDKLKKGNELRFTWHPDGTLSTVVTGERKTDLLAPELCKALFDVYIGSDPISKSGKKKLVKRLPDVLK